MLMTQIATTEARKPSSHLSGVSLALMSFGVAFFASSAHSQSVKTLEDSELNASESAVMLEPVVVRGENSVTTGPDLHLSSQTGSRLGLTAMETPASVEVIGGETMTSRGQTSINEAIAANSTGIAFIGTQFDGGSALSARGFTGNASITRLYDGVRLYPGSNTLTFPFDPWMAERIEVLHGPASVLYGEGGIGGAINVIPKKPLFEHRRNEILATVGSFGEYGLAGGSAGPITENLAYSIDVSGRGSDGWMERGDAKSLAVSGSVATRITEDWTLTVSHDYGRNEPSKYSGTPTIDGEISDRLRKKNYGVLDAELSFKDRFTQVHSQWTPSSEVTVNARFYHITSERFWKNADTYKWNADTEQIDRVLCCVIGQEYTQTGGAVDVKLETELFGRPSETILGIDLNSMNFKRSVLFSSPKDTVDPINPSPGYYGPSDAPTVLDSDTKQYSIFADQRVQLTDKLSVIGGLRYDRPDVDVLNPSTGSHFSATLDTVNWRVGSVYEITENTAIYAQYSEASDAFGSIVSLTQSQKDLRLPRGIQYEAGVKTSLLDGRLQATLSAYRIDKRDLLSSDPLLPNVSKQIGAQSSEGLEASIGIDLGHGVRIDANGTVLRARYDDYVQVAGDFTGNTPANVPTRLANVWANWNVNENWSVFGGINYVGSAYADDANTIKQPSYTLVNAGLSWKPSDVTTFTFHARNLFDEVYATKAFSDSQWYLGNPRSFALTMHTKF